MNTKETSIFIYRPPMTREQQLEHLVATHKALAESSGRRCTEALAQVSALRARVAELEARNRELERFVSGVEASEAWTHEKKPSYFVTNFDTDKRHLYEQLVTELPALRLHIRPLAVNVFGTQIPDCCSLWADAGNDADFANLWDRFNAIREAAKKEGE